MATTLVTGAGGPGGGPLANNESIATDDQRRGDMSAEIQEQENVLQMVDTGFDEERIFDSIEYQFSMNMLEDSKLRGNLMYEKLVKRISAWYLNVESIRIEGLRPAQAEKIR